MSVRLTGGEKKGFRLSIDKKSSIRPTSEKVRSAVFSVLGSSVIDAKVLDLYAGTGAFGFESLSRGAKLVDFVELDGAKCFQIRNFAEKLGFKEVTKVYRGKAEKRIKSQTPWEKRIDYSNFTIDTDGNIDEVYTKVKKLYLDLIKI